MSLLDTLTELPPAKQAAYLVVALVVIYVVVTKLLSKNNKKRAVRRRQAMPLPKADTDGVKIYRAVSNAGSRPKPIDELLVTLYPEVTTLYEGFQRGLRASPDGDCLGTRAGDGPYTWLSYKQVNERLTNLGSALYNELGLRPGDKVGIYSQNRAEWVLTEQACNAYSWTVVPLYDTLGTEAVQYVLNLTELSVVVCSAENIDALLENAGNDNNLTTIVSMDPVDKAKVAEASKVNINLLTMAALETMGKANVVDHQPPAPEDLATICFTSGTTGNPKGAMLNHRCMIADISGVLATGFMMYKDDVHISYLPLAHMFERLVEGGMFMHGAAVGFFRGDIKLLFDDIQTLRPTVFPSVPRLYNRLYDKVTAAMNASPVRKWLFETGLKAKQEGLKNGELTHWLWDRLLFGKVAAKLGGRVRVMATGSAPISPDLMAFLRCCFSCQVHEGYGQTETAAAATVTLENDFVVGHVGPPLSCVEIKLVPVPEMGYGKGGKKGGEVCFRGPCVFQGYYRNEKKTAEALDEDGWLHSGDIGEWTTVGCLKITDRVKHIFKLSQGEYVAPEKLEQVYVRSQYVAQMFVTGVSVQPYLVAVAVLDEEQLDALRKASGAKGDLQALCDSPAVNKTLLDDFNALHKEAKLKGFERIKKVYVHGELFSVDNDLLTPTFKNKRPKLRDFFAEQIDAMYAE